ncbi:MAG TPA: aldo/keto reductase, partial [Bryobacteraceae bacterium]|nr:aldo/keto reductase [Bryobacteraceae bacterium]
TAQHLQLSSLGIGSYLGAMDAEKDTGYTDAVMEAVRSGVNVIDTSLNYRNQRSEKSIGLAIHKLADSRAIDRDQIVVCTKAGFLVPNGTPVSLDGGEVAGGMHCMAPAFLSDQLERSRVNLGLETIDVFYLHNPETQLAFVSRDMFELRVRRAFEALESFVHDGKIMFYGAATWEGFRKPASAPGGLSLTRLVELAQDVAGGNHHFRFIQLPLNLAMTEGYTVRNESDGSLSTLAAAAQLSVTAVASASLLQARLSRNLPAEIAEKFPGTVTDAQRALQFARSTPGITTALVGMSNPAHVAENLALSRFPALSAEEYRDLFNGA